LENTKLHPPRARKRVLVIGWEVGESIASTLPSEGYEIELISYHGGPLPERQVFDSISHGRFDIVLVTLWNLFDILLDIRMRFPAIKTIFLNSYKFEWDVIAQQAGVNAVIRVPFQYDELLDQIRKTIES
jgi:hypothetical protein